MLLTDRSSGFLSDQHTWASKSTEPPFFSPKGAPEIHGGRVRPASVGGIRQCRTRERCFYAFTKLNLLFPLSLPFPVTHNYPRLAGFAGWAVHNTRLGERSRLKGQVSLLVPLARAAYLWDRRGCGRRPLFSLGGGGNCLQLRLLLPRLPWVVPKVQPQRVRRGIPGFPSVLMLAGVSVWSGSGQQAGAAGASPGKSSLLLLATQVA